MNFHVGTFRAHIRLLAKFEFDARTRNKMRLNVLVQLKLQL